MKVHQFAVGFLVALCATLPSSVRLQETLHEHFLRHHVIRSMAPNQCTEKISSLNIYEHKGRCKPTNTFILATADDVNAVCTTAGRNVRENIFESNNPFNVIDCTLEQETEPRKCVYNDNEHVVPPQPRRITVRCEKGVPVHYADN
uniref:Ribonuclease A-domain domain-containing protein n=1 Tax=Pygocentrus nattereri TaxID=42514 RepID=A0AAR2LHS6_PYGNA